MKLKTAIETLQYISEAETIMWAEHHYDALKLGIEAMKRIIELHEDDALLPGETYPGETEE